MAENNPNPPINTVSLDTDISSLNLGFNTPQEAKNAIDTLRANQINGPKAPESYDFTELETKFANTFNPDSKEHKEVIAACRANNLTQQQMVGLLTNLYEGQAAMQKTQADAVNARDDALVAIYNGSEDEAQIVWDRVATMGVDPNTMDAESIADKHDEWLAANGQGSPVDPNAGLTQDSTGQKLTENSKTIQIGDHILSLDYTNDESLRKFSQLEFDLGNGKKVGIFKHSVEAMEFYEDAVRKNAEHKTGQKFIKY